MANAPVTANVPGTVKDMQKMMTRIVMVSNACLRLMGEPGLSPRAIRILAQTLAGIARPGVTRRMASAFRQSTLERRREEIARILEVKQ